MSDIVLDDRQYHTEWENVTWEKSTIRSWLNGYGADMNQESINYSESNFIDSTFTAEEQSAIADSNVVNSDNLEYDKNDSNNTTDKIFMLSESEVYKDAASVYGFVQDRDTYDEARRCKSSDYAKAMGVYCNFAADDNCLWWLCLPGSNSDVEGINNYGNIGGYSYLVDDKDCGVRAALNLKLSASGFYTYAGTVCSDGSVNESTKQEVIISNPKITKAVDAQNGQNVKYDCVYFGSYPQTEVKYTDKEYKKIQGAGGWNKNGDIVINGTKYHRICKSDATENENYKWEDDTTYHYFKYEPVKWRVLKTDRNKALLLSDLVLDYRDYDTKYNEMIWETSTIRSWLNGYGADINQEGTDYSNSNFIDSAFTAAEQSAIADTDLINNDSLMEYRYKGGNDTIDKLFLLSESDMYTKQAKTFGFSQNYFVYDISRICKRSNYAKAMGAHAFDGDNCGWWLRTASVSDSGYVTDTCGDVCINFHGVRVALNLKLSSSDLYTYAGTVCSDGTVNSTEEPHTKKSQTIKAAKSYEKVYGAKPFKLNAKLTKGNGKLSYTTSNKKVATVDKNGKVTVKGTGICTITVTASATDTYKSASAKITITVKPKKNTVAKVKSSGSRTLNVTWKKDIQGSGYELQYSTAKNFSGKSTVMVNISKNRITSYKIGKLLKGKKYYVRVRTYRNVKINRKTKKLYGDWSTARRSGKVI